MKRRDTEFTDALLEAGIDQKKCLVPTPPVKWEEIETQESEGMCPQSIADDFWWIDPSKAIELAEATYLVT